MQKISLVMVLMGSLAAAPAALAAYDFGSAPRIAKNDHDDKGKSHGKSHGKPEKDNRGSGHGKDDKPARGESETRDKGPVRSAEKAGHKTHRFADNDRSKIEDYYRAEYRKGNCPPGLDKKDNGCLPLGQARKWARGEYLPRDARYSDLPSYLYATLAPAPYGYRYVEVYGDVLLIDVSNHMIVDTIFLTF